MKKAANRKLIILSLFTLLLIGIPIGWVAVSRLGGAVLSVTSSYDSPIKSLDPGWEQEQARLRALNGSGTSESGASRGRAAAGRSPASDSSLAEIAKDAPWWDVRWKKRRLIGWDPSRVGKDLLDFPIAIKVESEQLKANLLFLDSTQSAVLPAEIEALDSSSGTLWVKVPNVSDGYIWMYWDGVEGDSIRTGQNRDIWGPMFQSVFHFADREDFSPNGTVESPGMFGPGREFRRHYKEFVNLGNSDSMLRSVPGATLSVWINARAIADTSNLISVAIGRGGPTESSRATIVLQGNGSIGVGGRASDEEPIRMVNTPSGVIRPGQWHHVAGIINYEKGTISIMVDGAVSINNMKVKFAQTESAGTSPISAVVGAEDNGEGSFYEGFMDEVRISGKALSTEWLRAEYEFRTKDLLQFGEIQNHPK